MLIFMTKNGHYRGYYRTNENCSKEFIKRSSKPISLSLCTLVMGTCHFLWFATVWNVLPSPKIKPSQPVHISSSWRKRLLKIAYFRHSYFIHWTHLYLSFYHLFVINCFLCSSHEEIQSYLLVVYGLTWFVFLSKSAFYYYSD